MNGDREENSPSCYFHPKEILVGVCPLCLNERLLVLASKQNKQHSSSSSSSTKANNQGFLQDCTERKTPIKFPKIFAFSSSLLNRFDSLHSRSDYPDDLDVSTSQEDSFISIKFGDNGAASWEKGKVSKVSLENCRTSWSNHTMTKELPKETNKSMIEHPKPRAPLRWRKRICQLFQLIRLKRPNPCHVSTKVEGVKVSRGWIRPLRKKKVHM